MFNFFAPKSVDSVLEVFTSAIADLEKVAEDSQQRSGKYYEESIRLNMLSEAADKEVDRALEVIKKLKAIVG